MGQVLLQTLVPPFSASLQHALSPGAQELLEPHLQWNIEGGSAAAGGANAVPSIPEPMATAAHCPFPPFLCFCHVDLRKGEYQDSKPYVLQLPVAINVFASQHFASGYCRYSASPPKFQREVVTLAKVVSRLFSGAATASALIDDPPRRTHSRTSSRPNTTAITESRP